MKIQCIAMVSLLSVIGCGDDDAATTGTTGTTGTTETTGTTTTVTTVTETGTTMTTETGTTMTTETGTTMTTETGATSFSPIDGVWAVTMIAYAKNACNLEDDGEQIALGLMNIEDNTFSLRDMEDPMLTFECVLTESAKHYACSSVAMNDKMKGFDAILSTTFTPEVLFSSDAAAEMPFDMTVECAGKDCAKVSAATGMDLPCLTEVNFTLQLVGG